MALHSLASRGIRPQQGPSNERGVALILVLAFLVIISGLMIAFFTSVRTERSGASANAASASANALADSAVNVVMAQIVDATKGRTDPADGASNQAWASQPGMIRTYANDGRSLDVYKLYSDARMIDSEKSLVDGPDLNEWDSDDKADVFTDVNAPVADASGRLNYPIVDPTAEGVVEGFEIISAPGYDSGTDPSASNNPAPMPVRWLYVLEDGTLVPAPNAPAAGGGLAIEGASEKNQITGRLAFWTDDESSKVNINTASEGVYWDVPRIFSQEDVGTFGAGMTASQGGLALTQPATHEYQRYAGHPATTSLSPILGKFLNQLPLANAAISKGDVASFNAYYNLTPRVQSGGSESGTKIPQKLIKPDADRLYASIDELMFTPEMTSGAAAGRIPNTSTDLKPKLLTRDALEKAKFFLTASSNAPEVTLYNTPRIAIWPTNENPKLRSAYDNVAAFCSRIGQQDYFFTRNNPRSPTDDYEKISRNKLLYQALQKLTQTSIPGFGGNFLDKYQGDRDQILTSIFDYIRCINLAESSIGATPFTKLSTFAKSEAGGGEVIPIRINNTQGFGRFDTIAEVALLFHETQAVAPMKKAMRAVLIMEFAGPMQGNVGYHPLLKHRVTGLDKIEIKLDEEKSARPALLPATGDNFLEIPGVQTWHGRGIGGTEGMNMAFMNKHFDKGPTKRLLVSGGNKPGNYPFFSKDIDLSATTKNSFELNPNGPVQVKVEILTSDPGNEQVVQTINLEIPAKARLKTPVLATRSDQNFNNRFSDALRGGDWNRLMRDEDTVVSLEPAGKAGNSPEASLPRSPDHTAGDIRMIAALQNVPSTYFRAHNDFMLNSSKPDRKSHGMMAALGEKYPGATTGKLLAVQQYQNGNTRLPDLPSRVGEYVTRADGGPADWDTGMACHKDGAYLNKPDEGDEQFIHLGNKERRIPYMVKEDYFDAVGQTYFSPNRQIPSALMLGSIPTGVKRFLPWQTLLFHPAPEDRTHPGKLTPPDHLLADLFWMPVVEPYAISQPFSTAGKVNMNYQIQPFTYIQRDTGMRAVMKSTKFMALQMGDSRTYKPHMGSATDRPTIRNARESIDLDETLQAFDAKFKKNEIFKSATQICEMNLVPQGQKESQMSAYWGTGNTYKSSSRKLTGDNLREKPYADIYPRLTTKSNTYTVHVRVQSLKKSVGTPHDLWVGGKDQVMAEYRGASTIERYIDVNDKNLPDFARLVAGNPNSKELNIDRHYRFRVVNRTQFAQ